MTTPTKEQLDELQKLGARLVFQGLRRDEMVRLLAALPGLIQAAREREDLVAFLRELERWIAPEGRGALLEMLERFGKR